MSSKNLLDKIKLFKQKVATAPKNKHEYKSYTIKIIADLISGLIIGVFFGYFTDECFNTTPIFLILFILFGFFIGFYIFYRDMIKEEKNKQNNH